MSAYSVEVTGEREVIAAMRRLERSAGDFSTTFGGLSSDAAADARALAPKLSGRLAASVRPARFKMSALVVATAPYAGVHEYGWAARRIAAQPFLRPAADTKADVSAEQLARELDRFIAQAGLN